MNFKLQVFPELADKRLSELTDAQKEDAREDWIRANHAWARDPDHIAFLLARIDALREPMTPNEARQLLEESGSGWQDYDYPGGFVIDGNYSLRELEAVLVLAREAASRGRGRP